MAKFLRKSSHERTPTPVRGARAPTRGAGGGRAHFVSNNLPIPATSFIGREREIAEIRDLLARARVITLTGAGGCGKSRLALQVGADVLRTFPDGVWLASLGALFDPALVPKAVAAALDIEEHPRESVAGTLVRHLRRRSLLLVMDNCEHLRDACAQLADSLIRVCPELRIIATSREPLRSEEEVLYAVPALPLPASTTPLVLESVKQSDAIRLFTDRSIAVAPAFQVTDDNAPVVVSICRQLDGIPLAIEMAAARMKVLAEDEILTRLADRFRLLTAGERRLPQHQTLRATLDWSHALLSQQEQTLLYRVSIFVGGWTLEAVERVCAGGTIDADKVLDLLTTLVDKSMVIVEKRPDGIRFRLLESVREYELERLAQTEETEGLRRRHLAWYLRFAEEADVRVRGRDQERWWERLDVEHDNLRSALQWATLEPAGTESGMRLATALGLFWRARGNLREGLRWFARALGCSGDVSSVIRAKALAGASYFARAVGHLDQAAAFADEALVLARRCGDRLCLAVALLRVGELALYARGDLDDAYALFTESLRHYTDLQDHWRAAGVLSLLGDVARRRGDLQAASAHFERSLALSREIGDRRRIAGVLRSLGLLAARKRDARAAAALFAESLNLVRRFKAPGPVADSLAGLGAAAALQGQLPRAARLLGAAAAQRKPVGVGVDADRTEEERVATAVRQAIGERAFTAASDEGRAMTFEQAIDYALAGCVDDGPGGTGRRDRGPLTGRERQIVSLLANGLTNREIASLVGTSDRTVESHVQHILNKLALSSRAQIAVWAVQHGIHQPDAGERPRTS